MMIQMIRMMSSSLTDCSFIKKLDWATWKMSVPPSSSTTTLHTGASTTCYSFSMFTCIVLFFSLLLGIEICQVTRPTPLPPSASTLQIDHPKSHWILNIGERPGVLTMTTEPEEKGEFGLRGFVLLNLHFTLASAKQ